MVFPDPQRIRQTGSPPGHSQCHGHGFRSVSVRACSAWRLPTSLFERDMAEHKHVANIVILYQWRWRRGLRRRALRRPARSGRGRLNLEHRLVGRADGHFPFRRRPARDRDEPGRPGLQQIGVPVVTRPFSLKNSSAWARWQPYARFAIGSRSAASTGQRLQVRITSTPCFNSLGRPFLRPHVAVVDHAICAIRDLSNAPPGIRGWVTVGLRAFARDASRSDSADHDGDDARSRRPPGRGGRLWLTARQCSS